MPPPALAVDASAVRMLGRAGEVAGQQLRVIACPHTRDCAAAAVAACESLPDCNSIQLQQLTVPRSSEPSGLATHAVLRALYRTWTANVPELARAALRCKRLSLQAQMNVNVSAWKAGKQRRAWRGDFCDELSSAGLQVPALGRRSQQNPLDRVHRLPPSTRFLVVMYADRASRWLCSLLQTMAYGWPLAADGIEVVILGWRPSDHHRSNVLYYTVDRIYTILAFLEQSTTLQPEVPVLYLDTDQLMQATLLEAIQTARELLSGSNDVVFAAERRCAPFKLQANESLLARRLLGRRFQPLGPHCLNSGSFVGTKEAVVRTLLAACRPCGQLSARSIAWRHYDAYSALAQPWIYNDQSVLMRLHLASNATALTLDYNQRLFHTNFGFLPKQMMGVAKDGRLLNRVTGNIAAFVHYNGNTKSAWQGTFAPGALARRLERSAGNPARQRERLEALFRGGAVTLLSRRRFERVEDASVNAVCADGALALALRPPRSSVRWPRTVSKYRVASGQ